MNDDAYFIGNNCNYVKHYRSPIIMRINYLKEQRCVCLGNMEPNQTQMAVIPFASWTDEFRFIILKLFI